MISEKNKRRALEEFRSLKQCMAKQQNYSIFQKLRNVKSFGDFKKKFYRKVDYLRRDLSFVVHEWIVSLFYGKDINSPYFSFR